MQEWGLGSPPQFAPLQKGGSKGMQPSAPHAALSTHVQVSAGLLPDLRTQAFRVHRMYAGSEQYDWHASPKIARAEVHT